MTSTLSTSSADTSGPVIGRLVDVTDSSIVLGLIGTDYRLHLRVDDPSVGVVGGLLRGVIRAKARRVDVVGKGGRFIEPVYGRPRRLQGTVVARDAVSNSLTVDCGCLFICALGVGQKVSELAVGSLVAFDVEPGAEFEPTTKADPCDSPRAIGC